MAVLENVIYYEAASPLKTLAPAVAPEILESMMVPYALSSITNLPAPMVSNLYTGQCMGTLAECEEVAQLLGLNELFPQTSKVAAKTMQNTGTTSTPINPAFNSAAAPTSECSAAKSEPVEPNATISVPPATKSKTEPSPTDPANPASNSDNEEWKSYESLPLGWILKRTKTNFIYMTDISEEFRSCLAAPR